VEPIHTDKVRVQGRGEFPELTGGGIVPKYKKPNAI
jgi:hypothetical protein